MKRQIILIISIFSIFTFNSLSLACTKNCDKECDSKTSNAEPEIRAKCEESVAYYESYAKITGTVNEYTLDYCIQYTNDFYRQDCMNECDECEKDKFPIGGCFIEATAINGQCID